MTHGPTMKAHPATQASAALLFVALVACGGCTEDRTSGTRPAPQASADRTEQSKTPPATTVVRKYDAQGRLLPSDEYVAGVRLPRGAEPFFEDDLRHVYRIYAPIDKVLAYIGPMMITGNVERRGKGAIYKRASVRGAQMSPTKVEVSILELGSSVTRISITELPPPPEHVPSSERTKAAARDAWRTLD